MFVCGAFRDCAGTRGPKKHLRVTGLSGVGRIFHSSILPSQKGLGSIEKASGVKTLAQPSSSLASDSRKQPTECIAASNIELLELYTSPGSCHGALVCHSYGPSPIQRKAGDACSPLLERRKRSVRGCGSILRHCRRRPRELAPASALRGALRHRRGCRRGGRPPREAGTQSRHTRDARARHANGSGTLDEMPTHETLTETPRMAADTQETLTAPPPAGP